MSNPYFNLNAFFSHSQSPHGSPDLIDQKEYVHVKKLKCAEGGDLLDEAEWVMERQ